MKRIYLILFALIVIFSGCDINQLDPSLPTWAVDYFIPLAKLDYTMSEAINDSTIFADSTSYEQPVLTINVSDSSDKERLSPKDLAIKPEDQRTSGGIGDVSIDSNTVESRKIGPGELLNRDLENDVGNTIPIPQVTITPDNVILRFTHIKSAHVREGSLRLEIDNQSFIGYRRNIRVDVSDSLGRDIGDVVFTDPIPPYSKRSSEPLDLAGKEITGTMMLSIRIPLAGDQHLITNQDLDDFTVVIGHMSEIFLEEGMVSLKEFTFRDSVLANDSDDQIYSGTIHSGGAMITVENRMNLDGILTLRLLNFYDESGSVFERDIDLTAHQFASEYLLFDDLYLRSLKGSDNIIQYFRIQAIVKPDNEFNISEEDSIIVEMASDSIYFKSVRGIFAPRTFDMEPVEKEDILDVTDIEGEIRLNQFEMGLNVYNALGIDMMVSLEMKGYRKDKSGAKLDSVRLEFTNNNTFPVDAGENDTPTQTELLLNSDNSNIVDFMAFLPTDIELWGNAMIEGEGTISIDQAVWVEYNIYSPFFMEIPSDIFARSDISEIEMDTDVRDNIAKINYVTLYLEGDNGLPVGTELEVHMSTDSTDLFTDENIIISHITVPTAGINENGYVSAPIHFINNNITLDKDQLNIFQNEILYTGIKGRIAQTNGVVKFRTSDKIKCNGYLKVNYQSNQED